MMDLDKLTAYDLPTGALALIAVALLAVAFRSTKFLLRLALFVAACGLLAGAVWWHVHQR